MRTFAGRLIALVPVLLGLSVLTYPLLAGVAAATRRGRTADAAAPLAVLARLARKARLSVSQVPSLGVIAWSLNTTRKLFDDPGYDDAEVTGWLAKARTATDPAARVRLYHQTQRKLAEDAPMLFLHFDAIIQASSARLSWTPHPGAVFRLHDARMS